ncbi:MAG: transporter substrate-binding domain-containing protein [Candidatus Fimadaptatus sp.]
MKKRIAALVLALAMILTCSAAFADKLDDIKAAGKIIVGTEATFAPYEFYYTDPETGEEYLAGFEMDLARGLAAELGVELEVRDQSFAGLITALRAGELDCIISGMAIKPDRMEVVDFSTPYYIGEQVMLVRVDDLEKYKTADDFAGLKIGAQLGSLQQGVAEEQFSQSETLLLDKVPLLMLELTQGNIEGVLCTDVVGKSYMTVYPGLAVSEVPIDFTSSGVAVAVDKGDNEALLTAINDYIAKVTENGEFDAWFATAMEQNGQLLEAEAAAEAEGESTEG